MTAQRAERSQEYDSNLVVSNNKVWSVQPGPSESPDCARLRTRILWKASTINGTKITEKHPYLRYWVMRPIYRYLY